MFFSLESLETLPIIKKLPFNSIEKRILGIVVLLSSSVVLFTITMILILHFSAPQKSSTAIPNEREKVTAIIPDKIFDITKYDSLDQEALIMAAEAYLKIGNTEKAGAFLERISGLNKQTLRQRRLTAELLIAQNRLAEAQKHLLELRKVQPRDLKIASLYLRTVAPSIILSKPLDSIVPGFSENPEIQYTAGVATKSTSPKDATLFLIESLNKAPTLHKALFLLGTLYREEKSIKDLHKSIKMLSRAVEAAPDSASYWSALGISQLELFETAETTSSTLFKTTENSFKTALNLQPNSANHLYNLAELYSLDNNYHFIAEELYTKSIEKSPTFWMASFKLGILYSKNRKHNGAVKQFRNALKYSKDNTRILHQLAASLEIEGNITESQEIYKQIVTLNPKDEIALYKLQLIK